MLLQYHRLFQNHDKSYDNNDQFQLAVSQVLTKIFCDQIKSNLFGEPQCYKFLEKCSKVGGKSNKLAFIMQQAKQYLTSNVIDNVQIIIRCYMLNFILQHFMLDTKLDIKDTMSFYNDGAFLLQKECRSVLKRFLHEMEDITFNIQTAIPKIHINMKEMKEKVKQQLILLDQQEHISSFDVQNESCNNENMQQENKVIQKSTESLLDFENFEKNNTASQQILSQAASEQQQVITENMNYSINDKIKDEVQLDPIIIKQSIDVENKEKQCSVMQTNEIEIVNQNQFQSINEGKQDESLLDRDNVQLNDQSGKDAPNINLLQDNSMQQNIENNIDEQINIDHNIQIQCDNTQCNKDDDQKQQIDSCTELKQISKIDSYCVSQKDEFENIHQDTQVTNNIQSVNQQEIKKIQNLNLSNEQPIQNEDVTEQDQVIEHQQIDQQTDENQKYQIRISDDILQQFELLQNQPKFESEAQFNSELRIIQQQLNLIQQSDFQTFILNTLKQSGPQYKTCSQIIKVDKIQVDEIKQLDQIQQVTQDVKQNLNNNQVNETITSQQQQPIQENNIEVTQENQQDNEIRQKKQIKKPLTMQFIEQISLLMEYKDWQDSQKYDQNSQFSIAVSKLLMQIYIHQIKVNFLNEPLCMKYLEKCAKQNQKAKNNTLQSTLNKLQQNFGSNVYQNIEMVIRNYMRNYMIKKFFDDAKLDEQPTYEFYNTNSFLFNKQGRPLLKNFFDTLQECDFSEIKLVAPSHIHFNYQEMQEKVKQKIMSGEEKPVRAYIYANNKRKQENTQMTIQIEQEDISQFDCNIDQNELNDLLGFTLSEMVSITQPSNMISNICPQQTQVNIVESTIQKIYESSENKEVKLIQNSDHISDICNKDETDQQEQYQPETSKDQQRSEETINKQPQKLELQHQSTSKTESFVEVPVSVQQSTTQQFNDSESSNDDYDIIQLEKPFIVQQKVEQQQPLKIDNTVGQNEQESAINNDQQDNIENYKEFLINGLFLQQNINKKNNNFFISQIINNNQIADMYDEQNELFKNELQKNNFEKDDFLRYYQTLFIYNNFVDQDKNSYELTTYQESIQCYENDYFSITEQQKKKIITFENKQNQIKILKSNPIDNADLCINKLKNIINNALPFYQSQESKHTFQLNNKVMVVPSVLNIVNYQYYIPGFNTEQQISQQGGVCTGCSKPLEDQMWFCHYTGKYFCNQCQCVMLKLPGSVKQLIFDEVMVSKDIAQQIIQDIQQPHILTECLPKNVLNHKLFKQAIKLRRQLIASYLLLRNCQSIDIQLSDLFYQQFQTRLHYTCGQFNVDFQKLQCALVRDQEKDDMLAASNLLGTQREYIGAPEQAVLFNNNRNIVILSVGYWSFKNICEVFDGALQEIMITALQKINNHFKACDICSQAPSACYCFEEVRPSSPNALVCAKCGHVLHESCSQIKDGRCIMCDKQFLQK